MKERIDEGFVPYLINVKMNDGDLKDPPWLADRRKTGGFLYETTIHLLDIALWLMGDAVVVKAVDRANLYPDLVDWTILLTFRRGGMGTVISSGHASWHPPTERVEIVGWSRPATEARRAGVPCSWSLEIQNIVAQGSADMGDVRMAVLRASQMHCRFIRETHGQILKVMRMIEAARRSQDRGEVIDAT